MLNMIDTRDKLKNCAEQQLIQEMQQPSGSAPQFMVLGEIERRKRMRADTQKQQGLMQPTVAQEAVSAAGVPQQGIAQVAKSLAPKTDMTQNTGVPNAQAASLPAQPNQPQRMADGGVVRMAEAGGLSGGTISAIASLKVNRPDVYEEYKDDPEMLAMAAEYFSFPATDSERTGLESLEAPYVDPYGPQGLAQRTSAAEVGNQARMASEAAQQREIDRMLGINAPLGSGRRGAPLDAAARRRISEEDMAMAVPVPRDDFRSFPVATVDMPAQSGMPFVLSESSGVSRDGRTDAEILAEAQAAIKRYSTGAERDPAGNLLPVAPEQPFDYGARRDAAGNLITLAPGYELTEAIAQQKRDEEDEFFFNAGMFDRTAPENVAAQPRGSELSAISAAEDLRQRIAQEDAAMAVPIPQSSDVTVPRRPQAEGIASFGVFDPLVDRLKEIRSEDAARNAAAKAGDLSAYFSVGSKPQTPTGTGETSTAADVTDTRFNNVPTPGVRPSETPRLSELNGRPSSVSELYVPDLNPVAAAAQTATAPKYTAQDYGLLPIGSVSTPEEKIEAEIASLNAQIASSDDEVLVDLLSRRKNGLVRQLQIAEAQTDTGEYLSDIPATVDRAIQQYVAPGLGLTNPQEAAARINAIDADRGAATAAERAREAKIRAIVGGATTVPSPEGIAAINSAAEAAEDVKPAEGVKPAEDVKPAAKKEIAAALKTVTDPAAMPPAIKSGTGGTGTGTGTGKKSGIAAEKSKMDQDKWLALAQAGFTLISTGDFGKAGSAGLAAYREAQKGAREERKLDAELLLRQAQMAKAGRGPAAKPIPAGYLTSLQKDKEDIQSKLAGLRPPVPAGKIYGAAQDPDAAVRTRLQNELDVVNARINRMYSQYGLGASVPNAASRKVI